MCSCSVPCTQDCRHPGGQHCQQMFHHMLAASSPLSTPSPSRPGPAVDLSTCGPRPLLPSPARTRPPSPTNRGCNSLPPRPPVSTLPASPCYPRRANIGALLGESPSRINVAMQPSNQRRPECRLRYKLYPDRSARAFMRRTPRLSITLVTRTCCFLWTCRPMADKQLTLLQHSPASPEPKPGQIHIWKPRPSPGEQAVRGARRH